MPLSPREEKAIAIRNAIVNSQEFMKWYEARKEIQPTPSDPYRAFMIDRSLRARYYDEMSWDDYVNRSDLVPVDNVQGTVTDGAPIHRTHRTDNYVPASKKRPQHDKERLYRDMQKFKSDFTAHYGIPDVKLIVERRSGGAVYARSPSGQGAVLIPEHYYEAARKSPYLGHRQQLFASLGHEVGHHTQFAVGNAYDDDNLPPEGKLRDIFKSINQPRKQDRNEQYAWESAKDFSKSTKPKYLEQWRGIVKLREKFAFGSYIGKRPPAMSGDSPKAVFDFPTNLILRPNQSKATIWGGGKKKVGVIKTSEIKMPSLKAPRKKKR